ncbi:MAG: TauD/TfdA family dioxygenase [Marinosulfonomonas sp.]|nr:TauD/TfdA family dioxygenase [Marinosulfonomonas sp.]
MENHNTQFPDRFSLISATDADYQAWRMIKLEQASDLLANSEPVLIGDLSAITPAEHDELSRRCEISNAVFYHDMQEASDPDTVGNLLRQFAQNIGLRIAEKHRSAGKDGIVSLQVSDSVSQKGYIPYSKKPMNWHTDGYYNAPDDKIRAMVLHCVRAADTGGVNQVFDPEIAYIRLRDENPAYITALMHPSAMTIPENREPNGNVRPASIGPVFEVNPQTGHLEMRYTARTRSIEWRDDATTRAAVDFLQSVLNSDDPYIQTIKMQDGDGLLCNNSLHNRTGFDANSDNASTRLLMRVRFHNRVNRREKRRT